jgi:hypothetical protein
MICNKLTPANDGGHSCCKLQRGHKGECRPKRSLQIKGSQVEHPSHYGGDVPHEVIKCLDAWGLESKALLWNAVKYIARAGKKSPDALQDLKKAQFYLHREIEKLEKANG